MCLDLPHLEIVCISLSDAVFQIKHERQFALTFLNDRVLLNAYRKIN